jgi:hypothetical protein
MEEYIKKSDVLEMLSLPSDILEEYIYELKGVWADEDWLKIRIEEADVFSEIIEVALAIAWSYGQIGGEHHKLWVIDQMVRVLCGSKEEYNKWVEAYQTPDGEDYWEWDTGIAP